MNGRNTALVLIIIVIVLGVFAWEYRDSAWLAPLFGSNGAPAAQSQVGKASYACDAGKTIIAARAVLIATGNGRILGIGLNRVPGAAAALDRLGIITRVGANFIFPEEEKDYSATLGATGGYGAGTYTFSLVSGTLPLDMTMSAGGILSGTPTAVGTSTFTVQVTSTQTGSPLTATQSFSITVGLAPAPPITISGLPNTPAPAAQLGLGVSAGSTYPIAIQGTITLTFAPGSGPDDPSVQFTTGGRTAAFQIPAGSSLALFPGPTPSVQTGTVAGTITLTLTLNAAGVDITPTPAPAQFLLVARTAPVITSATVTPTSGGFNLVLVGYSTTRDMISAAVTFTPTSGVTLASNSAPVSLSQVFTTWYQSPASAQFGSMFSLAIPFTIQNGANPLASLSVALTNSQGTSAAATAAF